MREKLKIANQLRLSRKKLSNTLEYKKLCSKCYHSYIIQCIIKGKKNFTVSFGSRYIENFWKRMHDWFNYIVNFLYISFLMLLTHETKDPLKESILFHFGATKPVHLKIAESPNESYLYDFLEKNGFKITEEHLYSGSTIYTVTRA